ncbi:MAG: biotin/lipoyl-containing protein, partial [Oscillospiraceae bacterium]
AAPAAVPADGKKVTAPMPGNILDVPVKVGDKIEDGQKLVVLEAMKMENDISAPCAGTVTAVCVAKGDVVETGATLVVIG